MAVVIIPAAKEEVRRSGITSEKSSQGGGPGWIVRLNKNRTFIQETAVCLTIFFHNINVNYH